MWFARAGKDADKEYGNAALEAASRDIEVLLYGEA